jgi:tellurite resistance protein
VIFIFGFRVRASGKSEGVFFCPTCGADRQYVLQKLRRWFTLFFVPIFPTGRVLAEQVACRTCGTAFGPAVLDTPTSATLTDAIRNAMRVAVVAMLRAGVANDPAARQAAIAAVRSTGGDGFDDAALDADLGQVDSSQLAAYLVPLARGLQEQGKETFVATVTGVAVADGPITPPETAVLETIGAALGLSAAHLRGVIATSESRPVGGDS